MNLVIIRHGETFANTLYDTDKQILIGALDSDVTLLTKHGKEQAEECRKQLMESKIYDTIDEIYSSDLQRTIQTSRIIFKDKDIIFDKRLRERSLGDAQGVTIAEIDAYPEIKENLVEQEDSLIQKISKRQKNGENYLDVYDRAKDFMAQFDKNKELTIAIVAHYHFIKCLLYAMNDKEFDENIAEINIENASPMYYEYRNGYFERRNLITQ